MHSIVFYQVKYSTNDNSFIKHQFDLYNYRIILEAAYSLYDKAFFDNLPTILIMAVIVSKSTITKTNNTNKRLIIQGKGPRIIHLYITI